jgi:ParB family transcriptional regulator, chromosome partitioning protein
MSLSPSTSENTRPHAAQELRELSLDMIVANPSQPRRRFDQATLEALAVSIGERGVLQPVLVRANAQGRYELIAGERRWRAAQIAGLEKIPALLSPYDDAAVLEVAVIENMAREDLTPIEEARACAMLMNELGLSHRQIGDRVGRHMSVVSNLIRLLNLSGELLELVEVGQLSRSHGLALLMAKDPRVRPRLARAAIEQGWTVRVLEGRAYASNSRQGPKEREQGSGQARDQTIPNLARVWGDALGAEVFVRALPRRKWRVEIVFDSPEGALALGGRIGEAVARGSKGQ